MSNSDFSSQQHAAMDQAGAHPDAQGEDEQMLELMQHAHDAELLERVVLEQHVDARGAAAELQVAGGKPAVLAVLRRAGAPIAAAAAAVAFLAWVVVSGQQGSLRQQGPLLASGQSASGQAGDGQAGFGQAGINAASTSQADAAELTGADKAARVATIGAGEATAMASVDGDLVAASFSSAASSSADFGMPDMSLVASLDPNAEYGLPSLTEQRRMVIAVPVRLAASQCLDWGVEPTDSLRGVDTGGRFESRDALHAVHALRVPSPMVQNITSNVVACAIDGAGQDVSTASHTEQVVLFEVEGPRMLLPFHDDDARAMAACLSEAVEIEQSGDSSFLLNKCAELAGVCLPSGLAVTATLVSR